MIDLDPLCNDLTSQKWTRCARDLNCGRPTCQNSNPVQCESTYCDPGCVCRDGYKQDESHDDYSYNETTGVSSYSIQCLTDQMCQSVLFNSGIFIFKHITKTFIYIILHFHFHL